MRYVWIAFGFLTTFFVVSDAFADCRSMADELVSWVDNEDGRLIAFQLSSNKSRDRYGHYSLGQGYLVEFHSDRVPEFAPLVPAGRAIFQPIPMYVMEGVGDSHPRSFDKGRSFPTRRRDEVLVHLTEDGELTIILRSWGNTPMILENSQCSSNGFGYYMSGLMHEGNGTRIISIVMRKVDF